MFDIGEELTKHWRSQGMATGKGSTEAEIGRFEQIHKVSLPQDMRNYLLVVDGMDMTLTRDYQDRNGFSFWPLSKIRSAADEAKRHPEGYWGFPHQDALFVFADYLDWCWAYAIRLESSLTEDSPVFLLGKKEFPIRIGNSFREFAELYLIDSPLLYDPPLTNSPRTN